MSYNSKYFERKPGSLEEAILNAVSGVKSQIEEQKKVKEKLDPVNKKALKKDFDDRKDKDIDNDGDVDSSDKYLAKRRKAVAKAIKKDNNEAYEMGTKEYADHTKKVTPGQTTEDWNKQVNMMQEKNNSMRSVLADMWGVNEGKSPFQTEGGHLPGEKKKKKDENKTMTGQPMTKVSIDPDMKEKVKTETSIGKKNVK